jgi:hypothetical protein
LYPLYALGFISDFETAADDPLFWRFGTKTGRALDSLRGAAELEEGNGCRRPPRRRGNKCPAATSWDPVLKSTESAGDLACRPDLRGERTTEDLASTEPEVERSGGRPSHLWVRRQTGTGRWVRSQPVLAVRRGRLSPATRFQGGVRAWANGEGKQTGGQWRRDSTGRRRGAQAGVWCGEAPGMGRSRSEG